MQAPRDAKVAGSITAALVVARGEGNCPDDASRKCHQRHHHGRWPRRSFRPSPDIHVRHSAARRTFRLLRNTRQGESERQLRAALSPEVLDVK